MAEGLKGGYCNHMFMLNDTFYSGLRYMLPEEREVAARIHSVNFYVEESTGNSGITYFRELNSYGDFHLIPSKMPFIVPPPIKEMTVEVPGSINGIVDMNEALTGSPLYTMREGTMEFMYENAYRYAHISHSQDWSNRWSIEKESETAQWNGYTKNYTLTEGGTTYDVGSAKDSDPTASGHDTPTTENLRQFYSPGFYQLSQLNLAYNPYYIEQNIIKTIHGKRVYMVPMDYPYYAYIGRIYIDSISPGEANAGTISMKYKFQVYKRRVNSVTLVNKVPYIPPVEVIDTNLASQSANPKNRKSANFVKNLQSAVQFSLSDDKII